MFDAKSRLIVGLGSFLVFLIITAIVFSNVIQTVDAQLALAINNASLGSTFTTLMVLFAKYGREYFWIPVIGAMLILGKRDTKLLASELAALFVAGIILGEVAKLVAYRPRPFDTIDAIILRLPVVTDSSYPSGHALMVSIGAAFSMVKFKKKIIALLLSLEAAVVCYSRIYVGVHYPSDVAGAIFLAIGVVGVGLFILERYLDPLLKDLTDVAVRIFRDGPLEL